MYNSREELLERIQDHKIIKSLYLDLSIDELILKLNNIKFSEIGSEEDIPFTAKLRNYQGASDNDGCSWLLKEITEEEVYEHKVQEVAYYLDFCMDTLAAPAIVKKISKKYYRATKIIKNAMQISSYNYLEKPFIKVLANDLINRWLFCDEDRNPNNYMIIHNSKDVPFVVVIDYNKADLLTKGQKIKGNSKKFGWHREEKTRFLTLLKPENFDNITIEDLNHRLNCMMAITESDMKNICVKIFKDYIDDIDKTTKLIIDNICTRREYINDYFRKWFKPKDKQKDIDEQDKYSGFGQSFLDFYKKKQS